MNWTIQDLGALGELIAAIGVVITLIYLAYQIRQNTVQLEQNTLAAQAAAVSASNMALRHTRHSIYESTEVSEIYCRGNENPRDLGEVPFDNDEYRGGDVGHLHTDFDNWLFARDVEYDRS